MTQQLIIKKDRIRCINKNKRQYEVPAENFKKNRFMHTVTMSPNRQSCTCGIEWCNHMWLVVSKIIGEEVQWKDV